MQLGRKPTVPVFFKPVVIIKLFADLADRLADAFLLL